MRTRRSEIFGARLLGALAKAGGRSDAEEDLEDALRAGGSRLLPSVLSAPPEEPRNVGGKGSGTTDYAEGGADQEDARGAGGRE